MSWSCTLLLLLGIPVPDNPNQFGDFFDNYHQALARAKAEKKPLLVVLNPGSQWEANAISIDKVRKTRERRALLKSFVVVVIDAASPHGKLVHSAYAKPKLPYVTILDNRQSYLLFSTSEQMYGQRWTDILTTYRRGVEIVVQRVIQQCPT